MKQLIVTLLFAATLFATKAQTIAQIKKELKTTQDPLGYVKFKLKKQFYIDTVTIVSSTSFLGLPDSLAYNGKIGKVYGPFKGQKILVKILAKLPNTFYHVSHIVIDTSVFSKVFADSLADNMIEKIQTGNRNFAAMATIYSADPVSAAKGGDLGWFVRGVMLPQLDEAIKLHKKGELFKVWTPAGLHVVTITDNPKKDHGFALLLRVPL